MNAIHVDFVHEGKKMRTFYIGKLMDKLCCSIICLQTKPQSLQDSFGLSPPKLQIRFSIDCNADSPLWSLESRGHSKHKSSSILQASCPESQKRLSVLCNKAVTCGAGWTSHQPRGRPLPLMGLHSWQPLPRLHLRGLPCQPSKG